MGWLNDLYCFYTKLFEKSSDPILVDFVNYLMAVITVEEVIFKPLSGEVIMLGSQWGEILLSGIKTDEKCKLNLAAVFYSQLEVYHYHQQFEC